MKKQTKKTLNFIDLFCGCGGWTEGFAQAGYNCVYSVDNWKPAAITHSLNHPGIEDDDSAKDVLSDEISQKIKFLILISDKLKLIYIKAKTALFSHYKLQNNLVNILKHIKEGKIFSDFIEKIIQIAIDYGYKYHSRANNNSKLIIYKDGSILSNSELKISHALIRGNFKGIEPFLKLYNSLKKAGENDIPVVGIVKDSQSLLLSKLFSPFGSDYHIVRNLALKQQCTYSYLSPVKKIIEPHKNIQIDNYFTFMERGISPLRLEVIPSFKPKNIKNFTEIIENTLRLIYQNENIHEFHKKKYKLPYCILSSDVVSRNMAKDANKLVKKHNIRALVESQRENHSKKPQEIKKRIVELLGDLPRIEL
ncbi:hypothetical protein LCGC14_2977350, partial [marine sediment metagenome]